MRYSESLIKTFKETPREAENLSSVLLLRGSFTKKLAAGIYDILPFGWLVMEKIIKIIREEMRKIGGEEVYLPTLQPKELWEKTGRWENFEPPLLKTKDRHGKEFAIGPTHEEVITDMIKIFVESYKDLPKMVYQIQNKYRNEQRFSGGLLRVKEFLMKDAYSFHQSENDLDVYYQKIKDAYRNIYERVGIEFKVVEADTGSIGGRKSHEFMLLSDAGEDRIYLCGTCDWAANIEIVKDYKKCPACGGEIKEARSIEIGHIFALGDLYSKKMNALFIDKDGNKKPIVMGCYGIGIGRLMSAVVESSHDEFGIIWPETIAPYKVYLIDLEKSHGQKVYDQLLQSGIEVLFDDRQVSAGVKFSDADLLGIPYRLVLSEKTVKENKIELKRRSEKTTKLINLEKIASLIK